MIVQVISFFINLMVINLDDFDYWEIVDFLLDLVDENGYDFIFDFVFGLDVIQEFQCFFDIGRKLSIIESDDYI